MTYTALARKWRPRTFSALLGQEHIKQPLINALNNGRIHHAYLFTGTRGVGKTSVARLIAKSLNCEQGISASPCLTCSSCIAIEQGHFIDLIEVDAASRTRVEDTRELLDNVQYVPTFGRYKVYLIDEVHMLSNHSFNALLKTLEEPPEHVKFLLATTDPQKLPITILSRCLQFNLRPLSEETIAAHLEFILKDEQINHDKEAPLLIARAAQGSARDALSLLDQAIAGSEGMLSTAQIKDLLGYSQKNYAVEILYALKNASPDALLSISQQVLLEGGPFQYVLDDLLSHLHQISIYQAIPNTPFSFSNASDIQQFSTHFSSEDIQLFYQIGIKTRDDMHLAPSFAIAFDMMLLRMYTFMPLKKASNPILTYENPPPSSLVQSTGACESVQKTIDASQSHAHTEPTVALAHPITSDPVSYSEPASLSKESDDPLTEWSLLLPQLRLTGLALTAAENAAFVSKHGSQITLRIERGHKSVFTPTIVKRLEQALTNHFQETIQLQLDCIQTAIETPAITKRVAQENLQLKAESALQSDPFIQELQHTFSGELIKSSIAPLEQRMI